MRGKTGRPPFPGLLTAAILLASCQSQGHFLVQFSWAEGSPPPDFHASLYMFAEIDEAGSTQPRSTAGPQPYSAGATLTFGAVQTGTNLVVNAQLRESAAANARVVAYGLSQPFDLPPGKDVTVTVPLSQGVHDVLPIPAAGSTSAAVAVIQANGTPCPAGTTCELNTTDVMLELTGGVGAMAALLSNAGAPTAGAADTLEARPLTPDPAAMPPSGFASWRYGGSGIPWDLNFGLPPADRCSTGTCLREVFVAFVDANGIPSAPGSTTVLINLQKPQLLNPQASPNPAGFGTTLTIIGTPSEQLQTEPVAHVYAWSDAMRTMELPDYLMLEGGSEYTFTHVVGSHDSGGRFFATFDLLDQAGNSNTFGTDRSVAFNIDTTLPTMSITAGQHATYSRRAGFDSVSVQATVDDGSDVVTGTIGSNAMSCVAGSGLSWTCSYTVQSGDTEGAHDVTLRATRPSGNVATASTTVTFDFTPPFLLSASGPTGTLGPGQTALLAFTPNEALSQAPSAVGSGPLHLTFTPQPPPGYSSTAMVPANPPASGLITTTVQLVDLVGNSATVSGPSFSIDTVQPTISALTMTGGYQGKAFSECGMTAPIPAECDQSPGAAFNLVSLSFSTNKALTTIGAPPQLAVTIGGSAMSCQSGTPSLGAYPCSCTYQVRPTDGSGSQTILLIVSDDAGNTTSATASVTFDTTPISLTANASPNPVRTGEVPALGVYANKVLPGPPGVEVSAAGGAQGSLGAPNVSPPTGPAASWTYTYGAQSPSLVGNFQFAASGRDNVGHVGAAVAPANGAVLAIDEAVPRITNVAIAGGYTGNVFSECGVTPPRPSQCDPAGLSAYNFVTLTFSLNKAIVAPGQVSASIGSNAMSCAGPAGGQPPLAWTCTYTVQGTEGSGFQPVSVTATDEVGASATATASATFDLTTPALLSASGPVATVGAGQIAVLNFAANKELRTVPSVTGSGAESLTLGWRVGSAYSFSTTIPSTPAVAGPIGTSIHLADNVGHATTVAGPGFQVDTVAPVFSSVATTGGVQGQLFSECGTSAPIAPNCDQAATTAYDLVTLRFALNKQMMVAGSSLTATIAGTPISCSEGSALAAPFPWTCTYSVQSGDGSGQKPIQLSATDEAGNSGSAQTSVSFDVTPLALAANVAPDPVNAAQAPVLTVTASKVLTSPPSAVAAPFGATQGTLGTPVIVPASGAALSWTYSYRATSPNVDGQFQFAVSGTDSVGHLAATSAQPSPLTVDQFQPQISLVATAGGAGDLGQDFSECGTSMPIAPNCDPNPTNAFNVVSLGFDLNKSFVVGSQVTATVGGAPMSCTGPTTDGMLYAYACTYAVGASDTEGARVILILATDEVGNVASASTTVQFDVTPLTLSAFAAPNPANTTSVPLLTVVAGRALAGPPTIDPQSPLVATSPVGQAGGTSWTSQLLIAGLNGTYAVAVQGSDELGHVASAQTSLVVDAVPPAITNIATNGGRYGKVAPFNDVALTFDSSVPLSTLDATIGGFLDVAGTNVPLTMTCGVRQSSSPNYTCVYQISSTGAELAADGVTAIAMIPEAILPLLIEGTDAAGNTGSGSTSVTFDFVAPGLSGTPSIEYRPAPNAFTSGLPACANAQNILNDVVGATTCTDVRTTFAVNEPLLGAAPVSVVSNPAGLTFLPTLASGESFVYEAAATSAGAPPDGLYAVSVTLTDLVGNTATIDSSTFLVDTTPDSAPPTAPGGPITYHRIPWGSQATSGLAAFAITGDAGSVMPGDWVIAYASPTATTSILGSGQAAADGSFGPIALLTSDRPVVWLGTADPAGNQSPVVSVHNVSWTATFNGRTPGRSTSNPHVMQATGAASFAAAAGESGFPAPHLLGTLTPSASAAPETASYAGISSPGGSPLVTSSTSRPWSEVSYPPLPPAREQHAMAADVARGRVVLFGGLAGADLSDTWEFDGTSWTQAFPAGGPVARHAHSMVYDSRRGVSVLFGGYCTGLGTVANDIWEWDGTSWVYRIGSTAGSDPGPSQPQPRQGAGMVYDSQHGVAVIFGGDYVYEGAFDDTWTWDGTTLVNQNPDFSPSLRAHHAMTYDSTRGVTVLFGGTEFGYEYDDTYEWDGSNWSVLTPATSPPGRHGASFVHDARRGVSILSGGISGTTSLGDTWEWDGVNWTQVFPADNPPARGLTAAAYDPSRGIAVELGGEGISADLNDTWGWDGNDWRLLAPASSSTPTAREFHSMAFDSLRGMGVLFGGWASSANADCTRDSGNDEYFLCAATWLWNGSTWTQAASPMSPSPRYSQQLAYDSGRGVTVLFGGTAGADILGDTWEWDGSAWNQRMPAMSPPGRSGHVMTYDSRRAVTVVFGGAGDVVGDTKLGDTWEWDGNNWMQVFPATSPPASAIDYQANNIGAMSFDSIRGVGVYFTGTDTWEWDGTNWSQKSPVTTPPTRAGHGMAFDPVLGLTVLLGGDLLGSHIPYNDVWTWDGTNWSQMSPSVPLEPLYSSAVAYDSAHEEIVSFSGATSLDVGPVTDTWRLPGSLSSSPSDIAHFDFTATGETLATSTVNRITIAMNLGGSSESLSGPSAPPAYGALVAAWDASSVNWRILGTTTSGTGNPGALTFATASSVDASALVLQESAQTINFAITTTPQAGRSTPGTIAVGGLELTVEYQHSESACTSTISSACICASDETVCGTGNAGICSSIASDPQNCGGCAGSGGVACAGGMQCISGSCACPGSTASCLGTCTDTATDRLNCGACGTVCAPGEYCSAGGCSSPPAGCVTAADCLGGSATPFCNVATGQCAQCESDEECVCAAGASCPLPGTSHCDVTGTCVAVP